MALLFQTGTYAYSVILLLAASFPPLMPCTATFFSSLISSLLSQLKITHTHSYRRHDSSLTDTIIHLPDYTYFRVLEVCRRLFGDARQLQSQHARQLIYSWIAGMSGQQGQPQVRSDQRHGKAKIHQLVSIRLKSIKIKARTGLNSVFTSDCCVHKNKMSTNFATN